MALSSVDRSCFYCDSPSAEFREGWRVQNGGFAMLCGHCASAYEQGRFCDIFHSEASGWRDCDTCKKGIHCGCIMSAQTHIVLDFGGVRCLECVINEALTLHQCSPNLRNHQSLQNLRNPSEIIPVVESKKVIRGISSMADSIAQPASAVPSVLPYKRKSQFTSGANKNNKVETHLVGLRQEPSVKSPNKNDRSCHSVKSNTLLQDVSASAAIHFRNKPKTSNEELEQICRESKSILSPLFEKAVTISDADPRNGRLVLPKRCAESFLPKLVTEEGMLIKVKDIRGKYWQFHYRSWANANGRMYVLEGLREFIKVMNWQPGDKVTFYRSEPEGNLVIGLKKAGAGTSK